MTAPRKWYPVPIGGDPGYALIVADDGAPTGPSDRLAAMPNAMADRLCAEHNRLVVQLAERPMVGDIEAMLARVVAAALRELLRDLVPHRLRRLVHRSG